jgi:hypothetical protein
MIGCAAKSLSEKECAQRENRDEHGQVSSIGEWAKQIQLSWRH